MHISGFRVLDLITEHTQATVVRATREADGAAVILKIFTDLDAAHAEAELLRRAAGPGVPALHGVVTTARGPALVMADVGKETLADRLGRGDLAFAELLSISLSFAHLLRRIHAIGLVHLDLKPQNLILAADDSALSLVDFGLARVIEPSRDDAGGCEDVTGTLGFCPPEQTGRTRAVIDQRSDLYGAGALMYFLATGRPPFVSDDPIELTSATLSRTPEPIEFISPWVPGMFARVVDRAMAKSPDDRYQRVDGLVGDLERCVAAIERSARIEDFELGLDDYRPLARPPVDFGRHEAVAALATHLGGEGPRRVSVHHAGDVSLPALVRVAMGDRALVVDVTASAGDRPLAPIHALVAAVAAALLDAPRELFDRARAGLVASLGDIGGVLVEMAPAMARVIGPQPALTELGPAETRARLTLALRHLSAGISSVRPLVLVVEDAHHLDEPSSALIEAWTTAEDAGQLRFFAASDASDATPMPGAVEMTIDPLDATTLLELVARTVERPAEEVAELAERVIERTRGNPAHMGEVMAYWAKRGILFRREGRWTWEIAALEQAPTPPGLGALLGQLVPGMPEADRAALELLSCLGVPSSSAALAPLTEKSAEELEVRLALLAQAGFVAVEDGRWWFAHPSVVEALREQLDPARGRRLHTQIGRALLERSARVEAGEGEDSGEGCDAFSVADQLRRGDAPRDEVERGTYARAFLAGGRHSAAATAFDDAVDFFDRAIAFGADESSVTFDAALWRARCLHMVERGEEARQALEALASAALAPWQVAQVHGALADLAGARLDREGAVDSILRGLARLGTKIPKRPGQLQTVVYLLRQERRLRRVGQAGIERAPLATDEVATAKMQLVSDLLAPAYLFDANLFLYVVETGLELFMAHGRVPSLPFLLSAHAMVIRGALKKFARAIEIQRTARAIYTADPAPQWLAKFEVAAFFTESLFDEPAEVVERLTRAGRVGLETGDTLFSAYAAHNATSMLLWSGSPLAETVRHLEASGGHYAGEEGVREIREIYLGIFRRLMAGVSLSQEDFDTIDALPAEMHATLNDIKANLVAPCFVDGRPDQAMKWIEQMLPTFDEVSLGYPQVFGLRMWQAIAGCRALRAGKRRAGRRAASTLRWMERSIRGLNPRLGVYPALLEAELLDARGRPDAAAAHFARAQGIALEAGQSDLLAYAWERRARIALARGFELEARLFVAEAHRAYKNWGHQAKCRALEAEFPWLGGKELRSATRGASGRRHGGSMGSMGSRRERGATSGATSSAGSLGEAMDLRTVLDLSREIATKVRLDDVVESVLAGVASNVGARHAALIHVRGETPVVLACRSHDAHQLLGRPVEDCAEVAAFAVDRVARSGEALVVDDARRDPRLAVDPGIVDRATRSLACVPLNNQGAIVGYLYLESDLMEGAFTPERLALVDMVSSQAAISLENAALYASLEARVAARTAELSARNQEMRVVLDNVTEGLLVLDREGRLSSERSAVVDTWLQGEVPETFSALLAAHDPQARPWFDMGWEELCEEIMPVELCLDQLPARIRLGERTVDLRWRAIDDGQGSFVQVLVVMSDVTAELQRQRVEAENRELMEVFARSQRDRVGYVEFVQSSRELVARLAAGQGSVAERFRWVHTLKGNCAVQGLGSVADACHEVESELAAEGRAPTPQEISSIERAWRAADARIRTFVDTERDVMEIERARFDAFLDQLAASAPALHAEAHRWTLEPVGSRLASMGEQAAALAERLGKGTLALRVDGGDLYHRAEAWGDFWQSFVHVVRNAVDHGLEEAEARDPAKGPPTLELRAFERGERFVIEVRDDGRGIDWDALAARAQALGLPHEGHHALIEAMFADGLSTRETATETSGRGVGMAAVREACSALEGTISVDSKAGVGTTFTFEFPRARLDHAPARNANDRGLGRAA